VARTFDRRTILRSIAVLGAASAFPGCGDEPAPGETAGSDAENAARFPHSVASGDPRQTTVILWTRAVQPGGTGDLSLRLEMALDAGFTQLIVQKDGLPATAVHDGCLKVRVKGLSPATVYHYRFSYAVSGVRYRSPAGRTRTAAEASADVPVRFAVANCQDYVGRYWNSYQQLLTTPADDLDFFIAIGDYIYETTASSFQTPSGNRPVTFSAPSEAIDLGNGDLAAKSVGNYRDLYRTYRSDPLLRQVHERWPVIATWDDHEYSDDCHGSVATYTDGRKDERDDDRRRNAEQAFFEWLPVDEGAPTGDPVADVVETGRDQLFPNQRLWRAFTFGKHLELVMTDLRSFRPDHPIPEDAFPGTVTATQETLIAALGQQLFDASFPAGLTEYLNVDQPALAQLKQVLLQVVTGGAMQEGLAQADALAYAQRVVKGNLGLLVVNQLLAAAQQPPLPSTGLERGLFYALLGKQAFFSHFGSRYVVVKDSYDLYSGLLYAQTVTASENAFGSDQEDFVIARLTRSTATHKVLVSSYSLISMQLDLTNVPGVPAQFARNFYFDADQWDGFPNKRQDLYTRLRAANVQNLIGLSGDIHAAFAGNEKTPVGTAGTPEAPRFVLLTSPAISSQTMGEAVGGAVTTFSSDPAFQPGGPVYEALVNGLPQLLELSTGGAIQFVNTSSHGYLTLACDKDMVHATFTLIPASEVTVDHSQSGGAVPHSTTAFDITGAVLTPV